jgi:hypothetical protein
VANPFLPDNRGPCPPALGNPVGSPGTAGARPIVIADSTQNGAGTCGGGTVGTPAERPIVPIGDPPVSPIGGRSPPVGGPAPPVGGPILRPPFRLPRPHPPATRRAYFLPANFSDWATYGATHLSDLATHRPARWTRRPAAGATRNPTCSAATTDWRSDPASAQANPNNSQSAPAGSPGPHSGAAGAAESRPARRRTARGRLPRGRRHM